MFTYTHTAKYIQMCTWRYYCIMVTITNNTDYNYCCCTVTGCYCYYTLSIPDTFQLRFSVVCFTHIWRHRYASVLVNTAVLYVQSCNQECVFTLKVFLLRIFARNRLNGSSDTDRGLFFFTAHVGNMLLLQLLLVLLTLLPLLLLPIYH